ncbi:MAG: hypothetical protein EXX96DRAFT_575850 [Benjaminiella poitrasii]|nr:MAG: hypothetical protein EXX96DRAFT_575850 [Benjaminiella poitrasii]
MSISKSFVQFENDDSYMKHLLDLIVNSLEQSSQDMKTEEMVELGEGFETVTRPWALVFLKDSELLKTELLKRVDENDNEGERKWLDLIQVCRIDTIHQIRAILCALHMKMDDSESPRHQQRSILDWMKYEKDGQPPSLIVVADLLDFLVHEEKQQNSAAVVDPALRYMTINYNELSQSLANLVESSIFESTAGKTYWENNLGIKSTLSTELVISDKAFLPPLKANDYRDRFQQVVIEKLHGILTFYLDSLYVL